jgi:hypothetical protein
MLIESIDVRDFRGIENTAATFGPLTVIRGANHQCKSSIAQAIQIGMTGRAKGTDAQGRGASDKIRHGAKKTHIHMAVRGKSGAVPLGITYGPGRTGRQVVTETPDSFLRWIDANTDRLCCSFDSEHFIRQKADEQKSILASMVLPAKFDFPETIREQVKTYLGMTPEWSGKPITLIDQMYDIAFDKRKTAKAALNAIHIPELPVKPAHSVSQIKAKLAELRERQKTVAVQQPSAPLDLVRAEEQLRQEQDRLRNEQADAADIRTALNDVDSDILLDVDFKRFGRIAAHRATYESLDEQSTAIGNQLEEQRQVQMVYRELLEEKTCPTCHQAITEAFINARIREAQETIERMGEKQRDIMLQQKELGNIAEAEQLIAAHKSAEEKKKKLQADLSSTVAAVAGTKELIRKLEAEIQPLKQAAAVPVDTTALDNLNAQITRVEAELTPAIAYENAVSTIEQQVGRKRQLQDQVDALEKLVTYFGKDGVKAKLIKDNIDAFERSVNQVLYTWGYAAKLSIEPYSFDVTLPNRATLPLKELSGSEEMMFAVALQTAIANHSGIRAVVVDKADTFVDEERNRLFACLSKLLADKVLEQAIVMVADSRTAAPQKEGVIYYAAQDGKLVKL